MFSELWKSSLPRPFFIDKRQGTCNLKSIFSFQRFLDIKLKIVNNFDSNFETKFYMSTKNIFNPVYRQDYFEGYAKGINPFPQANCKKDNLAFISGFNSGRMDYEEMNGRIKDGIPQRIVNNKVLEDFLLSGLLGLSIDTDGYTPYQLDVIEKWYLSGVEKYDPNHSIYLFEILEENGIQLG